MSSEGNSNDNLMVWELEHTMERIEKDLHRIVTALWLIFAVLVLILAWLIYEV